LAIVTLFLFQSRHWCVVALSHCAKKNSFQTTTTTSRDWIMARMQQAVQDRILPLMLPSSTPCLFAMTDWLNGWSNPIDPPCRKIKMMIMPNGLVPFNACPMICGACPIVFHFYVLHQLLLNTIFKNWLFCTSTSLDAYIQRVRVFVGICG